MKAFIPPRAPFLAYGAPEVVPPAGFASSSDSWNGAPQATLSEKQRRQRVSRTELVPRNRLSRGCSSRGVQRGDAVRAAPAQGAGGRHPHTHPGKGARAPGRVPVPVPVPVSVPVPVPAAVAVRWRQRSSQRGAALPHPFEGDAGVLGGVCCFSRSSELSGCREKGCKSHGSPRKGRRRLSSG